MVAVAMRDQDMREALAFGCRGNCLQMGLVVGAWIDDRDLAGADEIGIGAEEGVRPGIVGDDAAHARRNLLGHAVVDINVAVEGKLRRHGFKAALVFSPNLAPILAERRGGGSVALARALSFPSLFAQNVACRKGLAWRNEVSAKAVIMVGVGRFELPTPCSRSRCATRLRYTPSGGSARI